MSPPGLTDEQISHFKTFGYIVLKGLLTQDELGRIPSEFDFRMQDQYGPDPYDGGHRYRDLVL